MWRTSPDVPCRHSWRHTSLVYYPARRALQTPAGTKACRWISTFRTPRPEWRVTETKEVVGWEYKVSLRMAQSGTIWHSLAGFRLDFPDWGVQSSTETGSVFVFSGLASREAAARWQIGCQKVRFSVRIRVVFVSCSGWTMRFRRARRSHVQRTRASHNSVREASTSNARGNPSLILARGVSPGKAAAKDPGPWARRLRRGPKVLDRQGGCAGVPGLTPRASINGVPPEPGGAALPSRFSRLAPWGGINPQTSTTACAPHHLRHICPCVSLLLPSSALAFFG